MPKKYKFLSPRTPARGRKDAPMGKATIGAGGVSALGVDLDHSIVADEIENCSYSCKFAGGDDFASFQSHNYVFATKGELDITQGLFRFSSAAASSG